MSKPNQKRLLKLRFLGEGFRDGHVPITIVASKLEALQALVFHAAATVTHDTTARRGQWLNKYRSVAELEFHASRQNCLLIETALLTPEDRLPGTPDVGADAVDLIFRVRSALGDNPSAVIDIVPDRTERAFVLRSMEDLCPNTTEDYQVELENCDQAHPKVVFSAETRKELRRLFAPTETEVQRQITIVGTLVKIHVEIAPKIISVQLGTGTEIWCYYDESMRDQISNLVAGSMVEVTGLATFDGAGNIKQVDSMLDVETVSMDPLRIARFVHKNVVYSLHHPVQASVERSGDIWIYNCPEINLWGVGDRREEAISDLNETFDFLWRQYAQENDALLDEKARILKRTLLGIVKQP